jgi:hypothetical protein
MSGKLFDSARGLPWIKSLQAPNDDEHSDRLNHRYTVGFLLICAAFATGLPFVFNRISCWVPAQFVNGYQAYTNNYCWISNTYYIPSNATVPHSKYDRERSEIGYYQWAPFIFLLSALFFYLPRMLWRSMNTRSGIDLQYLVSKSREHKFKETPKEPIVDTSEKPVVDINEKTIVGTIENYCQPNEHDVSFGSQFCRILFCTSGKRLGNYIRSIYLTVKFLYLINSFIQLILIHIILGQPGWFYGLDVWYSIFIKNSVLTDSPYFPRVTLCDLRIREIGNLHRYTVQCVLPINMLNEKLFSLAWFWFIYVFLSNLFSLISTLYETIIPNSRFNFIRDLYRISRSDPNIDEPLMKEFTRNFLMQDGVLIIEILSLNGSSATATRVVKQLVENYEKNQEKERLKKTRPQLNSSDV